MASDSDDNFNDDATEDQGQFSSLLTRSIVPLGKKEKKGWSGQLEASTKKARERGRAFPFEHAEWK